MTTSDWAIAFMLSIMAVVAASLVMRGRKSVPTYEDVAEKCVQVDSIEARIRRGLEDVGNDARSVFLTLDTYKKLIEQSSEVKRSYLYSSPNEYSFTTIPTFDWLPVIVICNMNMGGLVGISRKMYRQDANGIWHIECQYCKSAIVYEGEFCHKCGAPMRAEFNILELHTV